MPEYTKPISTPMLESKTTRDVATGAAVAGGTAYGIVAAARALLGDASMPWGPEADAAIAVAATAILTPLLARVKAMFRRGTV